MVRLITFPAHPLVVVEERLRDQAREGVRMPERIPLDELALRIPAYAEHSRIRGPRQPG
jgi:hypothetical protein